MEGNAETMKQQENTRKLQQPCGSQFAVCLDGSLQPIAWHGSDIRNLQQPLNIPNTQTTNSNKTKLILVQLNLSLTTSGKDTAVVYSNIKPQLTEPAHVVTSRRPITRIIIGCSLNTKQHINQHSSQYVD